MLKEIWKILKGKKTDVPHCRVKIKKEILEKGCEIYRSCIMHILYSIEHYGASESRESNAAEKSYCRFGKCTKGRGNKLKVKVDMRNGMV